MSLDGADFAEVVPVDDQLDASDDRSDLQLVRQRPVGRIVPTNEESELRRVVAVEAHEAFVGDDVSGSPVFFERDLANVLAGERGVLEVVERLQFRTAVEDDDEVRALIGVDDEGVLGTVVDPAVVLLDQRLDELGFKRERCVVAGIRVVRDSHGASPLSG